VKDPYFIGILLSGYHSLIDGHIYHRNNVVKIRYDLIDSATKHVTMMNAMTLLDIYYDVYILNSDWVIDSDKLLCSYRGHR
jgi:hypothetical protein